MDSTTVSEMTVHLVRTGVEDGLSAPITFDSLGFVGNTHRAISTTLEKAISFVMNLEAREVAVFGLQPVPMTVWPPTGRGEPGRSWEQDLLGDDPILDKPSSHYVDSERYPEWSGDSKHRYCLAWLWKSIMLSGMRQVAYWCSGAAT
ncbi:hypothetical protein B0T10DRAFT_485340 [Thelonectria olida]|uniref:Uncharacterized protein n=1 Tax=Thelonectria olida TaxID=1576542 RepID=A0A9P9ARQ3_9HYPO|nr:hypothetical protein B0T10DRAFT_485340 [Thelonectria olida]